MPTLRTTVARHLLPRYAAGTLPRALAAFVRGALRDDVELAAAYTELRRVERAAARGAPMSASQIDLIEGALFDVRQPSGAQPRGMWLAPVAAAACVAVFVMVGRSDVEIEGAPHPYGAGDLLARGEALAQDPLGVKVSCLQNERVVDTATAGARRRSDAMACSGDGMLAFAVTNLSHDERWLFIVGVAGDGSARWYAPFERRTSAVRAAAGMNNAVLPALSDMRSMPQDANVTLHVLLSDRAFDAVDVERQLDAARARGVPLGSVDKLPLPDIPLQARVDLAMVRK